MGVGELTLISEKPVSPLCYTTSDYSQLVSGERDIKFLVWLSMTDYSAKHDILVLTSATTFLYLVK
jgi:hypothetical protein